MNPALSVLELAPIPTGSSSTQALNNTLELAQHIEALGYTRMWLAEHHNMSGIASSVPAILISQVARVTNTLRVGSGGVMLPNHAPLHVAETFKLLEAFFPGRIDLGIGRAPGTDTLTALALRRSREALAAEDFEGQLAELFAFGTNSFPEEHPYHKISAIPNDVPLPPVTLLGSSDYSARLAGSLGLSFAFAAHFSPHAVMSAVSAYRQRFKPGVISKPHLTVALSVFCAPTDDEADFLAGSMRLSFLRLRQNQTGQLPTPEEALHYPYSPEEQMALRSIRAMQVIGSPASVRQQLEDVLAKTQADELMITTTMHSHEARLRSFKLLAEAFQEVAA